MIYCIPKIEKCTSWVKE